MALTDLDVVGTECDENTMTHIQLRKLRITCRNQASLDLLSLADLTSLHLVIVREYTDLTLSCSELQELVVTGLGLIDTRACGKLQRLTLERGDASIIPGLAKCSTLRELTLIRCVHPDFALCPALQILRVFSCSMKCLTLSAGLKELCIEDCEHLTEICRLTSCADLRKLRVRGCPKLVLPPVHLATDVRVLA